MYRKFIAFDYVKSCLNEILLQGRVEFQSGQFIDNICSGHETTESIQLIFKVIQLVL